MGDPISIAGLVVSGIDLFNNLAGTYRDIRKWEEKDLEVDNEWLPLALQKGVLDGKQEDYGWMSEKRVPTAEMKNSHAVVVAHNKEKKIIYRLVMGKVTDAGGRNILVRKLG